MNISHTKRKNNNDFINKMIEQKTKTWQTKSRQEKCILIPVLFQHNFLAMKQQQQEQNKFVLHHHHHLLSLVVIVVVVDMKIIMEMSCSGCPQTQIIVYMVILVIFVSKFKWKIRIIYKTFEKNKTKRIA